MKDRLIDHSEFKKSKDLITCLINVVRISGQRHALVPVGKAHRDVYGGLLGQCHHARVVERRLVPAKGLLLMLLVGLVFDGNRHVLRSRLVRCIIRHLHLRLLYQKYFQLRINQLLEKFL